MIAPVATLKPVIRCCKPESEGPKTFRIPKRIERVRRAMESKRLDNLKEFHEALVKAGKQEQEFFTDLFKRRTDAAEEATADKEEDLDEE